MRTILTRRREVIVTERNGCTGDVLVEVMGWALSFRRRSESIRAHALYSGLSGPEGGPPGDLTLTFEAVTVDNDVEVASLVIGEDSYHVPKSSFKVWNDYDGPPTEATHVRAIVRLADGSSLTSSLAPLGTSVNNYPIEVTARQLDNTTPAELCEASLSITRINLSDGLPEAFCHECYATLDGLNEQGLTGETLMAELLRAMADTPAGIEIIYRIGLDRARNGPRSPRNEPADIDIEWHVPIPPPPKAPPRVNHDPSTGRTALADLSAEDGYDRYRGVGQQRLRTALRELSDTWVALGLEALTHIDADITAFREKHDFAEATGTELEAFFAAIEGHHGTFHPLPSPAASPDVSKQSNRELRALLAAGEAGAAPIDHHQPTDWIAVDGVERGSWWVRVPAAGWECSVYLVTSDEHGGHREYVCGSIAELVEACTGFLKLYATPGTLDAGSGADWSAVSATNFVHRLVAGRRA